MIAMSKSSYRHKHPDNDILFNAKIYFKSGFEWGGDLDLTVDFDKLQKVSDQTGKTFIILLESLGRWNLNDKRSYKQLKKNAHAIFKPNKSYYKVREYEGTTSTKINYIVVLHKKPKGWKKVGKVDSFNILLASIS